MPNCNPYTALHHLTEEGGSGTSQQVMIAQVLPLGCNLSQAFYSTTERGWTTKKKPSTGGSYVYKLTALGKKALRENEDKIQSMDELGEGPTPRKTKPPAVNHQLSEAANAAVEGIEAIIAENQDLHKMFKGFYIKLHTIYGEKDDVASQDSTVQEDV